MKQDTTKNNFERDEKFYDELWNYFLSVGEDDFKSSMGYGKEDIERIGIKKFIQAVDWRNKEHIDNKVWNTDRVKILVCNECGDDFAKFPMDYSLCDKCKDSFDLSILEKNCDSLDGIKLGASTEELIMFSFYKEYRDLFKK